MRFLLECEEQAQPEYGYTRSDEAPAYDAVAVAGIHEVLVLLLFLVVVFALRGARHLEFGLDVVFIVVVLLGEVQ